MLIIWTFVWLKNKNEARQATSNLSPTIKITHKFSLTPITTSHKLLFPTITQPRTNKFPAKTSLVITINVSYPSIQNSTNPITTKTTTNLNTITKSRLSIIEKEKNWIVETKVSQKE